MSGLSSLDLTSTLKNAVSSPALLNAADRVAHGMYVVPAGHRFRTLAFSLGFSLAGNGIMHVLTARYGDGTKLEKKDAPFFLRPLHGILEHNKYSDDPEDRWKHVAARAFPVVGAAVGAYLGSRNWAANSPAGASNLNTSDDIAALFGKDQSAGVTAAGASIFLDAQRGHAARVFGGILQALGLHSGIHQLVVPSVLNLGIGLGGAFLGANNRTLNPVSTDGLKKSTKEMADHVGRNTYNKVLSELAKEDEAGAKAFLAETMKKEWTNPEHAPALEKAFKHIKAGGGVDQLENYANRVLNRYFARAAVDYKKSIQLVGGDLRATQQERVGVWIEKIKEHLAGNEIMPSPENFKEEIEKIGQSIITDAFGNYNRIDPKSKDPLPFLSNNFLKTIRDAQLDETKIELGERNWVYRVFEWMGGDARKKAEKGVQALFAKEGKVLDHLGIPAGPVSTASGIGPNAGAALLGTAALGSMAALSASKEKKTHDLFAQYREEEDKRGLKGFLNHAVLPKFEFLDRMSIADPSWGRFWLAGGFSLGLVVTDYLLQVPFGRTISSAATSPLLPRIAPLPMPTSWRNAWSYDPLSGTDSDRWMKNAHTFAVMAGGAIGTFLGARYATKDRRSKLRAEGTYLDDFEERVTFAQGKAWEIPTAISSTPGSALGTTHFGLIPGINYGANIANFHLLANGGKIAWQGAGKHMIGSQSQYRFGPVKLIDHMIQYAAYNPDECPKQLTDMAAGIVRPWFPEATDAQVNAFAGEVLKVRNAHWQQGGIAAEKKEPLIKELKEHFRGAGLEKTLLGLGLNPAEAKLGNNGIIGNVSEIFGAKGEVKELKLKYLNGLKERLPEAHETRASSAVTRALASHAVAGERENDRTASFSDKFGTGRSGSAVERNAKRDSALTALSIA